MLTLRPSLITLLLFTAACGGSSEATKDPATPASGSSSENTSEAAPAGEKQAFIFGWKVPCRVPVVRTSEKRGKSAKLRFFVAARPTKDDKIEVRVEDTEFLVIDGRDATTPEAKAQLAPMMGLMGIPVPMIISREGEYLETRGLDELIERLLSSSVVTKDPKAAEQMKQSLRSPQMKATLIAAAGDSWNAWVGAWVGLEARPGEVIEGEDSTPGAGDDRIPVRVRVEHHGPTTGSFVKVSVTSTVEGEKARSAVAGMVRDMVGPDVPKDKQITLDKLRRVARTEAETDPKTLLPRHVRIEQTSEMVINGQAVTAREFKDDVFDWSRAEGCR